MYDAQCQHAMTSVMVGRQVGVTLGGGIAGKLVMFLTIDREFEFYRFFSFLKFNEFYEFFFG